MEHRLRDNLCNITKNHDEYLGSMRSSRINSKTAFDYDHMQTLTKNSLQQRFKVFDYDDGNFDTACTTKRIILTPVKKQKITDNESKAIITNSHRFSQFNKYNNPFTLATCHKNDNNESNKENSNSKSNKENSNIKSNLFSSQSPFTEEESYSNTSSGFKIPAKKLEFSNNFIQGKFESVRMNLQKNFTTESFLMSNSKQEQKLFTHSLISSSESSSQDNTFISKNENNSPNEKDLMLEKIKEINMITCSQQSQTTVTESLLEGLNRRTVFNIPKEKTNDEKYKILALKKIRKSTHKDNKSTSKVDVTMRNCEEEKFGNPESMMQFNLFNKKRKIVHSVKKIYASEIGLTDPITSVTKKFRIFKDSDIGINEDWQKYLKESKADEDVPTDEELVHNATIFVHNNLTESITLLYNNRESNMVNNICYIQK